MDVGLSMLVPLREWSVFQGFVLLLSALPAILDRLVEHVLPTEPALGPSRPALVSIISVPPRLVRSRFIGVSRYPRADGSVSGWKQARSVLPTPRSSLRSRDSG